MSIRGKRRNFSTREIALRSADSITVPIGSLRDQYTFVIISAAQNDSQLALTLLFGAGFYGGAILRMGSTLGVLCDSADAKVTERNYLLGSFRVQWDNRATE